MDAEKTTFLQDFEKYYLNEVIPKLEELKEEHKGEFKFDIDSEPNVNNEDSKRWSLLVSAIDPIDLPRVRHCHFKVSAFEVDKRVVIRMNSSDDLGKVHDARQEIFSGFFQEFQEKELNNLLLDTVKKYVGRIC
jgi:hypothetical protein